MSKVSEARPFITSEALLEHWQGHRRLTRRVIEAFPADELFRFTIGGMRTFGAIAQELQAMAEPTVRGIATGEWDAYAPAALPGRDELLRAWDGSTAAIDRIWPDIRPERFEERMKAFGEYEGRGRELVMYVMDNEIHHRGQGYVYLRALGIEPPPFWERD